MEKWDWYKKEGRDGILQATEFFDFEEEKMTSLIVAVIGILLLCSESYWFFGIVLIICAGEIINKETKIRKLTGKSG